jgi:hypothetical protein
MGVRRDVCYLVMRMWGYVGLWPASAGVCVLWRQEFYGAVGQRDTSNDRINPSRVSRSVSGLNVGYNG